MNTRELGSGSDLGSGVGVGPIDEPMRELISPKDTHNILKWTPMIFGSIKQGNLELLDCRLGAF